MAIVRCRLHAPVEAGGRHIVAIRRVGYPGSALICGSERCDQPAFIWLEGAEKVDYDSGTRIFQVSADTIRIRGA